MAGGSIPANLAPVFQAAGKANNIPAPVLAGIASVESNLGQNLGPSSTGAYGLMQFEPGTAASLGVDRNNPVSEIWGAAKLLNQYGYQQNPTRAIASYNAGPGNFQAGLGYAQQVTGEARRLAGAFGGGPAPVAASAPGMVPTGPRTVGWQINATTVNPPATGAARVMSNGQTAGQIGQEFFKNSTNPFGSTGSAFGGQSEGQLFTLIAHAQNGLQKLAGKTVLEAHPIVAQGYARSGAQPYRGYVDPIPHATVGRTDMGVDANLPVGSPIRAIGNARVAGIIPNWYQGQPLVYYQLLDGPKAGQYVYVAEQITNVAKPGTILHAGDPVAYYAPSGTGIEIGWAAPNGQTLAQAQGNTGDSTHGNAPAGIQFRNFLGSLHG